MPLPYIHLNIAKYPQSGKELKNCLVLYTCNCPIQWCFQHPILQQSQS